jgi:DinB superfamily
MTDAHISDSYPIGKFVPPSEITKEQREIWIDEIAALPQQFREALNDLNDDQLDTPYREGGWTLRQVAHHVPDSHLNAYIRFKWALTEDFPTIKAYEEADWAKLPDTEQTPIETSLQLLTALHERWVILLKNMSDADFQRAYLHPEFLPENFAMSDKATLDIEKMKAAGPLPNYIFLLEKVLGLYAWHGKHHTAHITALRDRLGW